MKNFFNNTLENGDSEIYQLIQKELIRQQNNIELIASENIVSRAVLEAQGSILTNKYAEGYPSKRYYGGCEYVDMIENLAINRVKELFNCNFANVQPHSGSQANMAVYVALLQSQDILMGMDLSCGGHLTHGSPVSFSGMNFRVCSYGIDEKTHLINYDEVKRIALENKPKLIIAGGSSYSRIIDFKKFREIADLVGAYLLVDMAHFAGLVAAGFYPNPLEYADICTSTTHKTLRGARGGLILSNNSEIMKKINAAIFPGTQGGPLLHAIAAKAVAFGEALNEDYKDYIARVIDNAKTMADEFIKLGGKIVSGGTDTHLLLLDLTAYGVNGKAVQNTLDSINITSNKNSVPFDTQKPTLTSGLRLGTPAVTTRGFTKDDIIVTTHIIVDAIKHMDKEEGCLSEHHKSRLKLEVAKLVNKYPIYE